MMDTAILIVLAPVLEKIGELAGAAAAQGCRKLKKVYYDDKIEEARMEGFDCGLRQGSNETAKKFIIQLETNEKFQFATWATLLYVARLDGLSVTEKQMIEMYVGAPDSPIKREDIQYEYLRIYEENLDFQIIKERYLDELDNECIYILDELIKKVMSADGNVVAREKINFYDYEWNPYVSIRRSEEYDKGR